MSDALRTLLAEFVIEVDKAGALQRGNAQIEALKDRLHEMQIVARGAAKGLTDVFAKANQSAHLFVRAGNAQALAGRADNNGFAGLGALRASQATKAADAAAAAYATTLRGKLGTALAHVREGFNSGGGGSKGPGLIDSLLSFRTAALALGAGAVAGGVGRLVDHVGGIGEAAQKLGVSTDDFQRLDVLAKQNATSVQALGTAFKNLANLATDPTKESAAAFERLGVSTRDSAGNLKSSQQLFFETSEALAGVANETERSALAQDVFGRSAQELKPIFANGAAAVRAQREELLKLRVLSPEVIAAADKLGDSWVTFKASMLAAAEPLIKVLIPVLTKTAEGLVAFTGWLERAWKSGLLARGAFVGLALGAARFLPLLRLIVGLGGGFGPMMLRWAGAALAASRAFLRMVAPLLILEDILGFFMGKDSLTGRGIEAAFGRDVLEGVQQTIRDLTEVFKDLWSWVFGNGQGGKVAAFYAEISQGVRLLINDLLAAIPFSGRTAGLAGLESFEKKEKALQDAGGGGFLGGIAAQFAMGFGGDLPAASAGGGAAPGVDARQYSVAVQVATGASPTQIAEASIGALKRSSSADLAAVESE
jgi:hypothetical protein